MAVGSLNGERVTRCALQWPSWGRWFADVDLDSDAELSGPVTLAIADQTFVGTVLSGGVSDGSASYRIVAGAGGWGKPVPAKGYSDPAGVKLATVVGHAAATVGETVVGATSILGTHYTRRAGRASAVLPIGNWYVDAAGVTQIGTYPEAEYSGSATRVRTDRNRGTVELAAESLAGLQPGAVVDGIAAVDLEIILDPSRLSVFVSGNVLGSSNEAARRTEALRQIFEALFPDLYYRGTYEFRVVFQSGEMFTLQPTQSGPGMPELEGVPVRPGMAGLRADVPLGSRVLVDFINADPSRPVIRSFDDPSAPGWIPIELSLGPGPGRVGIATFGSTVVAGAFAGTVTSGSAIIKTLPGLAV